MFTGMIIWSELLIYQRRNFGKIFTAYGLLMETSIAGKEIDFILNASFDLTKCNYVECYVGKDSEVMFRL